MTKILHIAIDGNSGSGKSTLSRHIANKYGITLVDSGMLYRFATFHLLCIGKQNPAALTSEEVVFLRDVVLQGDGNIFFKGVSYCADQISMQEVKDNVAYYAKLPFLRQRINEIIWRTIADVPAVVNGRDIGTVVLPNAAVKVYLEASVEQRINGWKKMLIQQHGCLLQAELQALIDNAILRDTEDTCREIAPLVCAQDAIRLKTGEQKSDCIFNIVDQQIDRWLAENKCRCIHVDAHH